MLVKNIVSLANLSYKVAMVLNRWISVMGITFSPQGIRGCLTSIPIVTLLLMSEIFDVSKVLARPIQSDQSLKKPSQVTHIRNQSVRGGGKGGVGLYQNFGKDKIPQIYCNNAVLYM